MTAQFVSYAILASLPVAVARMFAGLAWPKAPAWVVRLTQLPALPFILFASLVYVMNGGVVFQLKHLRALSVWGDRTFDDALVPPWAP